MKNYIRITASFLLSFAIAQAAPLTQREKLDFIEYYKKRVKLLENFPNNPQVKVIFVDMDGDGKEETLATSKGSSYEDGYDWAAFRLVGDSWESIEGFDNEAKIVRPGSGVFARSGEIFRVVKNDKSVEFLVLWENFDKLAPDGMGELHKTRFSLDKEGVFRQDDVANLERYIAYAGANRSGLISKLEVLKVESFAGNKLAKTEEQNKAQHPTDGAPMPEKPKE